jgi:hypothetical protein
MGETLDKLEADLVAPIDERRWPRAISPGSPISSQQAAVELQLEDAAGAGRARVTRAPCPLSALHCRSPA